jgi:hypothetical protein
MNRLIDMFILWALKYLFRWWYRGTDRLLHGYRLWVTERAKQKWLRAEHTAAAAQHAADLSLTAFLAEYRAGLVSTRE